MNMTAVKGPAKPRTRRAEQAERTRRRILAAATELFLSRGYAATTIEAIAAQADVAVETVYSRFGSKAGLLNAILGPAISGTGEHTSVLDRPELAEIRACPDQRRQLQLMARFSRAILQRTDQLHRILDTAASSDPKAAELRQADRENRYQSQRTYIDILLVSGPLRDGLTPEGAQTTYATLASPETYAFLTGDRGWAPEQYEHWLADSLTRLLLP
jgi:AcrR family transcriptional regulator